MEADCQLSLELSAGSGLEDLHVPFACGLGFLTAQTPQRSPTCMVSQSPQASVLVNKAEAASPFMAWTQNAHSISSPAFQFHK